MNTVQQEAQQPVGQVGHVEQVDEDQVEYLMAMMAMTANQLRQKVIAEVVLLLVDSGAFEHVSSIGGAGTTECDRGKWTSDSDVW